MSGRLKPAIPALACACAIAAFAAPAPAADQLGRLFFTPEQRATLDTARSKKTRVNLTTEETPTEKPPPPPAPEVVTYSGVVQRSDGKSTVWLNNQPVNERDLRSGASMAGRVRADGRVTVQSAQTGRNVELRVGQSAELLSGSVEEGYAKRGTVAVKPQATASGKPESDVPATAQAKPVAPERNREERDRDERMENAVRALEEAAAKANIPVKPAQADAPPPTYR